MMVASYWPTRTGGTENHCRRLAECLVLHGHKCVVLTMRSSLRLRRREVVNGVEVVRIGPVQFLVAALSRLETIVSRCKHPSISDGMSPYAESERGWLRMLIKKLGILSYTVGARWFVSGRKCDVIHVHTSEWISGVAGWIGSRVSVPVVCKEAIQPVLCEFGDTIPFRHCLDAWRRRLFFLALTESMADDLVAAGISRDRVFIVPNGVVIPSAGCDPTSGSGEHVVTVANLTQGGSHKAFDVLLDAWSIVHRNNPRAILTIVGVGDPSMWKLYASRLGCQDTVCFAGYVSELSPLLRKSGIFVLPSRKEGVSNALLEAQAMGLPAVVSDIPGNRAVVIHGVNGLVVRTGDADALAEALLGLMWNEVMRRDMAACARERARTVFGMDIVCRQTIDMYMRIVSRSCHRKQGALCAE